jgi:Protein of unknown function (DUF664)
MVDDLIDPRRSEPPYDLDERAMPEAWLEFHRTTLLRKCEGLDDGGRTARPVPSSSLSLHGLVRRMAEGGAQLVHPRPAATARDAGHLRRAERRPPRSRAVPARRRRLGGRPGRLAGRVPGGPGERRRARPRRHRSPARAPLLVALDLHPHDRGVRPPQRPRRSPRARRRQRRSVGAAGQAAPGVAVAGSGPTGGSGDGGRPSPLADDVTRATSAPPTTPWRLA